MLDETTRGVFTIAATPFLPDGEVDFDSIDCMVDAYIEKGANGLTILGMMGEAGKLSPAESVAVVQYVISPGTVPVIVGVSAAGFTAMTELSNEAMDAGAAGVMVAPPPPRPAHGHSDCQLLPQHGRSPGRSSLRAAGFSACDRRSDLPLSDPEDR